MEFSPVVAMVIKPRRLHADAGASTVIQDITAQARANPSYENHEAVFRVRDDVAGLEAMIAIHSRTLGPALGGTRVWPYENRTEALTDVLRLSRGMTMKSALAQVPAGGGKAVIIGDPGVVKTEAALRAYGRALDRFGGTFITGEDVGLSVDDADVIGLETNYIVGTKNRGGDPAPATALGVYTGIRAAAKHRLGADTLKDLGIVVQGLGHVGSRLAKLLVRDGAVLSVTDIDQARIEEVVRSCKATAVDPNDLFDIEADVFSPCAMGGVIADGIPERLRVAIVAGSANNQLLEPRHGEALHAKGILYAPDYVINGGGLIALALEALGGGFSWPRVRELATGIGATLNEVFEEASRRNVPPERVTDEIAEQRVRAAAHANPALLPTIVIR